MSKVLSETQLSDILDRDFTWRVKELSDLKRAILDASSTNRDVLLKSLITLSYAHWEGYVRSTARTYFDFITTRKLPFEKLNRQYYIDSFLIRLSAMIAGGAGMKDKIAFLQEVLLSQDRRFAFVNNDLINTKSNLSFAVLEEICLVCAIDISRFNDYATFIDRVLLDRRNNIAHGSYITVDLAEMDDVIAKTISAMRVFRNEIENSIYTGSFRR